MGALLPSIPNLGAGLRLSGGMSIPTRINYEYFFDRSRVINAMDAATRRSLQKAGSVVFQIARRSIKRKGLAHPTLVKARKEYAGMGVRDIIAAAETGGRKRLASSLKRRMLEIRAKAPSAPGTPPHTHLGNLRDKPGIVYAYDPTTESVVVGQSEPTIAWLAALHEYGGQEDMVGWAWIPRWKGSYRAGIIGYWRVGRQPRKRDRWEQTSFRKTVDYPARPYMRPAFAKAVATNRIPEQFRNSFRFA